MAEDRMQMQRFELKYIIREEVALQVRDFVACYLECDEFGQTMPNLSYPVHSLYLDSDVLSTYRATINGDKNRYKLRLRFYEDRPDAPVFFEVKSRTNNTISKKRGGVRRDAVEAIINGQLPSPSELISKDPKNLLAVQAFCRLMNNIGARPKAHIAYQREAWISRFNNSVRVTMDRQVLCDPEPTTRLSTRMINPTVVFGDSVILELKFTNRFPSWFGEMVRVFGLFQCGAAKYADGVAKLGEYTVNNAFHFDDSKKLPTLASHSERAAGHDQLSGSTFDKT